MGNNSKYIYNKKTNIMQFYKKCVRSLYEKIYFFKNKNKLISIGKLLQFAKIKNIKNRKKIYGINFSLPFFSRL